VVLIKENKTQRREKGVVGLVDERWKLVMRDEGVGCVLCSFFVTLKYK